MKVKCFLNVFYYVLATRHWLYISLCSFEFFGLFFGPMVL